jgi:hypothetical protein
METQLLTHGSHAMKVDISRGVKMFKRKALGVILVGMLFFGAVGVAASCMEKGKLEEAENENLGVLLESDKQSLLTERSSDKVSFIGDGEMEYWAVIIGIGDYNDSRHNIPLNKACIYDALSTAKNWDKNHIVLLVDENATRSDILSSLDWLRKNANPDDIILFSYQGHGYEVSHNVGIVPWEGIDDFITVDELDEKFDEINAKGMCLIFDCCLSGSFVEKKDVKLAMEIKIFRERFTAGIEGNDRVILMSTMKGGLGASIKIEIDTNTTRIFTFSNWIAEALDKTVDYNKDGICSAEEVFIYAKIRFFPIAIFLLNPIWQLKIIIATGHPILAFPQIYDGYEKDLPIVVK